MNKVPAKTLFIEFVAATFVCLFVYTALTKFNDHRLFLAAIKQIPLLHPFSLIVSFAVPVVEILIGVLLFIPASRSVGLVCATALMAVFTCYVALLFFSMKDLPCSCGGVIAQLTWPQHLVFNILFLVLGLSAIVVDKRIIAINRRSRIPA